MSEYVDELNQYRKNVERMWEINSSRIFTNGSTDHASIVLESFLVNAKQRCQIFCYNLAKEVFDSDSFIQKIKAALRRGVCIDIIAQQKPEEKTLFMKVAENLDKTEPLSLKYCDSTDIITLGLKHNFTVVDKKAYRFEKNRDQAKALVCINDSDIASSLSSSFDQMNSKLGNKKTT